MNIQNQIIPIFWFNNQIIYFITKICKDKSSREMCSGPKTKEENIGLYLTNRVWNKQQNDVWPSKDILQKMKSFTLIKLKLSVIGLVRDIQLESFTGKV